MLVTSAIDETVLSVEEAPLLLELCAANELA
jgi:hypothetical protein